MSQLFASGSQKIGASVLPMNIQGWFHKNFLFNTYKLLEQLNKKKTKKQQKKKLTKKN